jgi:hypothetical protein
LSVRGYSYSTNLTAELAERIGEKTFANLKSYKEIAELLDIDPSKVASDDSSFVTGIELFVDGGRAQI